MNFMTLRMTVETIVSVTEDLDTEDVDAMQTEVKWQVAEFTAKTGLVVTDYELEEC